MKRLHFTLTVTLTVAVTACGSSGYFNDVGTLQRSVRRVDYNIGDGDNVNRVTCTSKGVSHQADPRFDGGLKFTCVVGDSTGYTTLVFIVVAPNGNSYTITDPYGVKNTITR